MDQTVNHKGDIIVRCLEEGCTHNLSTNIYTLSAEEIDLLCALCDPDFHPTPEEDAKIKEILHTTDYPCPQHGLKNIGLDVRFLTETLIESWDKDALALLRSLDDYFENPDSGL